MYCVNCGVRLADTETSCPLCRVKVGAVPERKPAEPLYPPNRIPQRKINRSAISGAVLILWMIPVLVCFFVDLQADKKLDWFYYVAGALALTYVVVALPAWFSQPNPVIFVPCDFAAVGLYLLLIAVLTGGNWYLPFALPVDACLQNFNKKKKTVLTKFCAIEALRRLFFSFFGTFVSIKNHNY